MRRTGSLPGVVLALLMAGLLLPAQAHAVGPDDAGRQKVDWAEMGRRTGHGFAVGFDAVIIRPLFVCATIAGSVLFVPVLAISAAGGAEAREEALELFVTIPAKGIYERPLGQF